MPLALNRKCTFEDYLALERSDPQIRYEYLRGEIFAMGGASESHNLIAWNIAGELRQQMKDRPCRAYTADMKVRVTAADAGKYPDVLALCGEPEFHDDRRDCLLNPSLIVEVLSPSTEAYDRGEKFAVYRRLASLREYLLVTQDRMRAELFVRQAGDRWLLTEFSDADDCMTLESVGCVLPLREIYDKVGLALAPAGEA